MDLKLRGKRALVTGSVVYLCSEAASATTGSTLRVDGGVVRSIL
jgi:enoyl-[acyl-carrier-protein] reductase (NADH)